MAEEQRISLDLFYKGTNPIHECSSLITSSSPKGPTSTYHHIKVRFQLMNLVEGWEDINIQSIAIRGRH